MATIWRKTGSPNWYIQTALPGGRCVRFSTRTPDRKIAEAMRVTVEGRMAVLRLFAFLREDLGVPSMPSAAPAKTDDAWMKRRWQKMNTRERQAAIFALYGGCCTYCGREVVIPLRREEQRSANRAVMDHRVPVVGGGADNPDNITLSCYGCNATKCDKNPEDFAEEVFLRSIATGA